MKNVKIKGYRLAVIVILAMMPIVVSAVEYKNSYKPAGYDQQQAELRAEAPSASFQSTSTLPGSGSALSATPMLGEDGTATFDGTVEAPSQAPQSAGPRKLPANPTPLGDAVLPLLLLALAYLSTRVLLKSRALKS